MFNRRSLALAGALAVLPQMLFAAEGGQCVNVSVPKQAIEARNGKWIELTPEQWEFLRGIYAMNPLTPPGLPYGDKAGSPRSRATAAASSSSSTATGPARRCRSQTAPRHDGRRGDV